ncbi:PIN domain-containing protein [Pseudonocardia sp. NPDC049635]|uniref:PIN domain-containing protein n=1 Tax=Pseudonocardia sp. NPDC049635 TaxID=3155506 RepID=UPI0033DCD212
MADVQIYAAVSGHPLGSPVRALFPDEPAAVAGIGSVLLLPEVLAKPLRERRSDEVAALTGLLSRLRLHPMDPVTAEVATSLAAAYRLRAAEATHLATAVVAGSDRFVVSDRKAFGPGISEVDVVHPEQLPG